MCVHVRLFFNTVISIKKKKKKTCSSSSTVLTRVSGQNWIKWDTLATRLIIIRIRGCCVESKTSHTQQMLARNHWYRVLAPKGFLSCLQAAVRALNTDTYTHTHTSPCLLVGSCSVRFVHSFAHHLFSYLRHKETDTNNWRHQDCSLQTNQFTKLLPPRIHSARTKRFGVVRKTQLTLLELMTSYANRAVCF